MKITIMSTYIMHTENISYIIYTPRSEYPKNFQKTWDEFLVVKYYLQNFIITDLPNK